MEKYIVKFLPENKIVTVAKGEDLLSAAGLAGIHINSACAGEGVCGKCKVLIKKGNFRKDSSSGLSDTEKKKGYSRG